MNKPKETKPFNLEHAKAGAPIVTQHGDKVQILRWDLRGGDCPILGLVGENENVYRWARDGEPAASTPIGMRLMMSQLGFIDGKPVFVGDEIELRCLAKPDEWKRCKAEAGWAGTWNDDGTHARWPVPVRVYPKTRMTQADIEKVCAPYERHYQPIVAANAALRHAIDNGQVMLIDDVHLEKSASYIEGCNAVHGPENEAKRAARDMAVAKAVRDACLSKAVSECAARTANAIRQENLASIIEQVAP